jgi:hypothetical protein
MNAREFRDDDDGYLAWLATHPDGFVINILRSHNTTEARVHRADCWTISGQNPRGGAWTEQFVKVCADDLAGLERWADVQEGEPIRRCGTCHPPAGHAARPNSAKSIQPAVTGPVSDDRCEIRGPVPGGAVVEAWAEACIRFQDLPDWQKELLTEIKTRCAQLEPSAGQVLHATFFGAKHPDADVENVVLYYIDSFAIAGRNGFRFEHGADVPPAPDGGEYPFCYRYALAPRSGSFADWQQGRTLASFDWTDLGAFAGEKLAAQVWLALARRRSEVAKAVFAPDAPFAVRVDIRPPHVHQRVLGNLVKGIFDGVVSAFQAHTDTTILPEVAARLAAVLPADPVEIRELLLDQRLAVLGVVPRLVKRHGTDVAWVPSDHLCVAGELLPAEPLDSRWAIRGEIVELIAPG